MNKIIGLFHLLQLNYSELSTLFNYFIFICSNLFEDSDMMQIKPQPSCQYFFLTIQIPKLLGESQDHVRKNIMVIFAQCPFDCQM